VRAPLQPSIPNDQVRKILEKYEVKDAPQEPPEKIYDQEDSPFAKVRRNKAKFSALLCSSAVFSH
jgi:hypothetical protein